jgi:endonuclease-3
MFLPIILNHVNRISTAAFNAIKIMEMNSRKSPYFTSEEESKSASSSKRQTRSGKRQAIGIKLDETTGGLNESANEMVKVKKVKKVAASVEENKADKPFLPENWDTVLHNIQIMRAKKDAPVDQMGAEQCADSASSPEVIKHFTIYKFIILKKLCCLYNR